MWIRICRWYDCFYILTCPTPSYCLFIICSEPCTVAVSRSCSLIATAYKVTQLQLLFFYNCYLFYLYIRCIRQTQFRYFQVRTSEHAVIFLWSVNDNDWKIKVELETQQETVCDLDLLRFVLCNYGKNLPQIEIGGACGRQLGLGSSALGIFGITSYMWNI